VTISTVGETLAQLMNTVMLTGYMFKSAEERYRLRTALGGAGAGAAGPLLDAMQQQPGAGRGSSALAPSSSSSSDGGGSSGRSSSLSSILDEDQYAPGVQKSRVQGDVLLWHKENGVEAMPAVEYIDLLEAEVLRLRKAAEAPRPPPRLPPAAAWGLEAPSAASPGSSSGSTGSGGGSASDRPLPQLYDAHRQHQALAVRPQEDRNELLEFIRTLEPSTVSDLTGCATPETSAAMDLFVERLLGLSGGADRDALRRVASETKATEMRQLLFWLMVVGWKLRALEMQIELERSFE